MGVVGVARDQLLEAAVGVLAERGTYGLTYRAVDERAGLSKGAASRHFATRRDLVAATAVYCADGDSSRHLRIVAPTVADEKALVSCLARLVEIIGSRKTHYIAYHRAVMECLSHPSTRPQVVALFEGYSDVFVTMLANCGSTDPHRHGRMLHAYLHGVTLNNHVDGVGPRSAERMIIPFTRSLLRAVRVDE